MKRWLELAFVLLVGVLIGWCAAAFVGETVLDSGLATLVGSAIGAGISVAGAMWVAIYQSVAHHKAAARYAGDATASVRDEAYCMAKMARVEGVETLALHAAKITETIDLLRENIKLWQSGMPYSDVTDYGARLRLNKVEGKLIEWSNQIRRDRIFLVGTLSAAVLENAAMNLGAIGDEIQEACEDAMQALKFSKPLPTEEDFVRRVAVVQEEDRVRQRNMQID